MFPIEKLQFITVRKKSGGLQLRAAVVIEATCDIDVAATINLPRRLVIGKTQESLADAVWQQVYGEMMKPLGDLMLIAMTDASAERKVQIENLVAELQAKLTRPV